MHAIRLTDLMDCLAALPAVELQGLALLRECQPEPGAWYPSPPLPSLADAVTEYITYTDDCARLAASLAQIPPVPLTTEPTPEFCL